jgi:hypothetical protein
MQKGIIYQVQLQENFKIMVIKPAQQTAKKKKNSMSSEQMFRVETQKQKI